MKMTRRNPLQLAAGAAALEQAATAQNVAAVELNWIGDPPPVTTGVSGGVPWVRGTMRPGQTFALSDAAGRPLPLQSWLLAYWPDGSMKFAGFATVSQPSWVAAKSCSS